MAHPDVLEAAVVGVPDEQVDGAAAGLRRRAEERHRRRRRVSCATGSCATGSRSGGCRSGGPFIDEVPKTSVGKFDKKVLRKAYADGELDVTTLS